MRYHILQDRRHHGFQQRLIAVALGLSSLLAFPAAADAQPSQRLAPTQWLAKMSEAFETLTYDGTFSFFDGADLTSMRIVHMVVDGEQRERLVHLDGAYREFVRKGDSVACVLMPGDELMSLGDSMPAGPFARAFVRDYDRLSEAYVVRQVGVGRVAGRSAVRLNVEPEDEHRHGYRLWLDEATGLLLRSDLVSTDGRPLEVLQFSRLRIGDEVDPTDLASRQPSGAMVTHLELEPGDTVSLGESTVKWATGWLPPGFAMASADTRRSSNDLSAIDTLMYSDGLAAFSVYVESMPSGGASAMHSASGATVAVSEPVRSDRGQHLVTVVGEIPMATARRIAQSVEPSR